MFLRSKLESLNHEIRHYPGPIARCDEHLPALLEERAKIMAELEHESCPPEALWAHDGGRHD
jgi:hypothetical protein